MKILSFQIYYPQPLVDNNKLIFELFSYILDNNADGALAEQYFIYYDDEKGKHLRLRIQLGESVADPNTFAIDFCTQLENKLSAALEAPISVSLGQYNLEPERYGGEIGFAVILQAFAFNTRLGLRFSVYYLKSDIEGNTPNAKSDFSEAEWLEHRKKQHLRLELIRTSITTFHSYHILQNSGFSLSQQQNIALVEARRWSGFLRENPENVKAYTDLEWESNIPALMENSKWMMNTLLSKKEEFLQSFIPLETLPISKVLSTLKGLLKDGVVSRDQRFIVSGLDNALFNDAEKQYASILCDLIHLSHNRMGFVNQGETVLNLTLCHFLGCFEPVA